MLKRAVVSAGHQLTAEAARDVLASGGNAYDAIVAGFFMACAAEPVLASLGGGGFLLADTETGENTVFDFFAHTPKTDKTSSELSFYPISVDFGGAIQEFHIGIGSVAVPGTVKGMFEINRRLGRMAMTDLVQPAIEAARTGVVVTELQSYIMSLVAPIFTHTAPVRALYGSSDHQDRVKQPGEIGRYPELADTLEILAIEGEALFYRGEIAGEIAAQCRQGGYLSVGDLNDYQVVCREPLTVDYKGHRILSNPLPSSGGSLITFALRLLENIDLGQYEFRSVDYLHQLAKVMELTNRARRSAGGKEDAELANLLDPAMIDGYRRQMADRLQFDRGTTHLNVVDRRGNLAAMTVTNGEGCGYMLANTGIMLNNMMGEADLNPDGFNRWCIDKRIGSMMSPTLMHLKNGDTLLTGSGGSNRIRSAVLQVLLNVIEHGDPLEVAVHKPRIHLEGDTLEIEDGLHAEVLDKLTELGWQCNAWGRTHFFFGGAHSVYCSQRQAVGVGDSRRKGFALLL